VNNVTAALERAGMWESTLLLVTADNGAWISGPKGVPGGANGGGSNYPLRGGKSSDYEGGTRTVAFLSGGFLPVGLRGTTNAGLLHVCDWYATFSHLAGVAPAAVAAHDSAVPAPDSINAWPSLLLANVSINGSIAAGGRAEVPIDTG
jgi:arylsulfatase I/J